MPIDASSWTVTTGDWVALLADVTQMKIHIEMVNNAGGPFSEHTGIDNVRLIGQLVGPPTYTTFGAGCAGAAGVPALSPRGSSLPKIGATFSTTVSPLGLTSLPFGLLGVSNTAWSGLPLPLDLTLIGMQGCVIYVSVDVSMRLAVSGSSATWDLPIPHTSNLLGQSLYQQAFVIDPLGSATSNAGTATIGY